MRWLPSGVDWRWLLLLPAAVSTTAPAAVTPDCSGPAIPLPQVCAPLNSPTISCAVPADVEGGLRQANNNVRQRASDLFSWQNLIALHWPAQTGLRGVPDPNKPLGSPGPAVWETWKETSEVFRQLNGQPVAPAPWEAPQPLPAVCQGTSKLLFRDEKVNDMLDATVQPTYADGALPGTLTDQTKRVVRYEIRMNRPAFDYVVSERLWDGNVQIARTSPASFPPGSQIAKAAWRELAPTEKPRYQTIDACLCEESPGGEPVGCRVRPVGLVGFHIMTKTPSAPQWMWSTFEQVDNVSGSHPSFQDPNCKTCLPNRQQPAGVPNQVARVIPIPSHDPVCTNTGAAVDNIAQLNADIQRALAPYGTPLRYYELVSTQWPVPPTIPPPGGQPTTVFEVIPPLLGNTTLETYIQSTSSCMGCHAVAGLDRRLAWVSADFTFTLNDAYPNPNTTPTNPPPNLAPASSDPLPVPTKPVTPWDQQNWSEILQGYQILTNTYEILPRYVGAKLHRSSCHLGGGRDPQSAWFVEMRRYYPTPNDLYNRINQCFERSENGTAICYTGSAPPGEKCDSNASMQSIVRYMDWLTEQWLARGDKSPPARGFPALPNPPLPPSEARGASVYLQKCAFCHNDSGQGRYESNTYYRPALWGALSYNAQAGIAKTSTFAAFVHANMPYGNAGALTVQEAWDVAFYVDRQSRPAGKSPGGAAGQ